MVCSLKYFFRCCSFADMTLQNQYCENFTQQNSIILIKNAKKQNNMNAFCLFFQRKLVEKKSTDINPFPFSCQVSGKYQFALMKIFSGFLFPFQCFIRFGNELCFLWITAVIRVNVQKFILKILFFRYLVEVGT